MKILLILSNVFNFIKFIEHFQYTMYSDGKESASSAGDLALIPGWEDPLEKEMTKTTPVFSPKESYGQRNLAWGHTESDTT